MERYSTITIAVHQNVVNDILLYVLLFYNGPQTLRGVYHTCLCFPKPLHPPPNIQKDLAQVQVMITTPPFLMQTLDALQIVIVVG